MTEETETLTAIMLQIDRFCSKVQTMIEDAPPDEDDQELKLKLGQAKSMLADLQAFYDKDQLRIDNAAVRTEFRFLVINLLWVAFRARRIIDRRTFRMLVVIEAAFTSVLNDVISQRGAST
jgi:hypothetical protein